MAGFPSIRHAQIWEWSSKTALQVMNLSILDDGWHIRDDWESIYSWPAHSCALNPLKKLWSIPKRRDVRQFNSKQDLWEAARAADGNAYASTIAYWTSGKDKRVMIEPERYFYVYHNYPTRFRVGYCFPPSLCVCVCVRLSVCKQDYSQTNRPIDVKLYRSNQFSVRKNWLDFGIDPNIGPDIRLDKLP